MVQCVSEEDCVPDEELMAYFTEEKMWGMEMFINLYECDRDLISDEKVIRKFIIDLCEFIKMKRYGEPMIEKFGDNPDLFGFSFVQLIYTSSLVGHCVEKTGDMYLDVFSCKEFPPSAVAEFSKNYFKAKDVKYGTLFRE